MKKIISITGIEPDANRPTTLWLHIAPLSVTKEEMQSIIKQSDAFSIEITIGTKE